MNRIVRSALAGAGVLAGLASASVAAANRPAPAHLTTAAATSAPADPLPIVKHQVVQAASSTTTPPTTPPPTTPPPTTPAPPSTTPPTTAWTGPTENGQPCSGCVAGDGHICPTGCDPYGNPLPPDPFVTVTDGVYCYGTGQTEATADHLQVVADPAADCYNGWYSPTGWNADHTGPADPCGANPCPQPTTGTDSIPCCSMPQPPDLVYTCWDGTVVDLTTGGQCPPSPANVGAIKPDGTCIATNYDNAAAQGWQILLQGCPPAPTTTTSTTSPPTTDPPPSTTTTTAPPATTTTTSPPTTAPPASSTTSTTSGA